MVLCCGKINARSQNDRWSFVLLKFITAAIASHSEYSLTIRWSYFSMNTLKLKPNHCAWYFIMLIIHLCLHREIVSISIRHRHLELVPSSDEKMTLKFQFRAIISRAVVFISGFVWATRLSFQRKKWNTIIFYFRDTLRNYFRSLRTLLEILALASVVFPIISGFILINR